MERSQMGLCLGAVCKHKCEAVAWEKCERKSSTKHVIEAIRLDGFTPPGSPFDRHSVVLFLLSMNNPG